MQSSRESSYHRNDSNPTSMSKPALLALSTAVVVGVILPLISPHLSHPGMLYHAGLHLASLSIATFLIIVSVLGYSRSRTLKLLFMMLGFMALGAVELLYMLDTAGTFATAGLSVSSPGIELPHVILLVMLCSFGLGVLKVDNK